MVLCTVLTGCPALWAIPVQRPPAANESPPRLTTEVMVTLLDGTDFNGRVVDADAHGLVLWDGKAPYVFAWTELTSGAVYRARLALLRLHRDQSGPTAEDFFELGLLMLERHDAQLAVQAFRNAQQLDASLAARVRDAMQQRRDPPSDSAALSAPSKPEPRESSALRSQRGIMELLDALPAPNGDDLAIVALSPEQSRSVAEQVKTYYSPRLHETFHTGIELVETPHFFIWTDLAPVARPTLAKAVEDMYAALCRAFGYDPAGGVFLGKCPIFCFRSRGEFLKFSRTFDDYAEGTAAGYTRSVELRGYVHVALYYQGTTAEEWRRFVWTLVHEGSHAFLHRFRSSRLIPVWINEGFAEMMAERVLGDRCEAGENAALLARQFVRYDWPVHNLIRGSGTIEVHQYAIAHSLVAALERSDPHRFAAFMGGLKDGASVETALGANFDGMTLDGLEGLWREQVRVSEPAKPYP